MARAVAPPPDNDDSSLEVTDIGATELVWTKHIHRIFLHCTSDMMLWCGHETLCRPLQAAPMRCSCCGSTSGTRCCRASRASTREHTRSEWQPVTLVPPITWQALGPHACRRTCSGCPVANLPAVLFLTTSSVVLPRSLVRELRQLKEQVALSTASQLPAAEQDAVEGAAADEEAVPAVQQLANMLVALSAHVSLLHERLHEALLTQILGLQLWTAPQVIVQRCPLWSQCLVHVSVDDQLSAALRMLSKAAS